MRTPSLILLVLVAVAAGVVALRMGGGEGAPELALPTLGTEGAPRSSSTGAAPRSDATLLAQPESDGADAVPDSALPVGTADALLASNAPRALEGTIQDRFGNPVRERVLLLAPGQGHPSAGADLTQFVTAVSSREGRFSLSLPHPGPWRLGVGAPGSPRLTPSEARTLDGGQSVQITLSGTAALEVVFEEAPGVERVTLDLVTLREDLGADRRSGRNPSSLRDAGGRRGFDRGNVERGTSLNGSGGGRGGPRESTQEESDAGDRRGASLAPVSADPPSPSWASLARASSQDLDLGGRGGRRGSGERQDRRRPQEGVDQVEEAPSGPPPEVWRSEERRTLEAEELAAGRVVFSALPAGRVARLVLSADGERYEGVARFTLVPDARVEVRVLPVVAGSGALTYLTSSKSLAPDESPAGLVWVD